MLTVKTTPNAAVARRTIGEQRSCRFVCVLSQLQTRSKLFYETLIHIFLCSNFYSHFVRRWMPPGETSKSGFFRQNAADYSARLNELDASFRLIFHIELSNERMADTISEAAGVKKLLLHSCHNITINDFEKSVSYLDLQKANAENLKEALW
jgi:hypothetical protein